MDRLAIFGWTRETAALVSALRLGADLEVSAVGEERPAALARARAALGAPCFQHIREMARLADFDVALVGAVDDAGEIAERAARRGADLLLDGTFAGGRTLSRAADVAERFGVALVVLRPWLRSPGVPAAIARLAANPPDLLLLDAVEDRPAMALVRDLVALGARAGGGELLDVAASRAGPADDPVAIAVQLRFAGERVASITARRGEDAALRLVASGGGSSLVLRREGGSLSVQDTSDAAGASEVLDGSFVLDAPGLWLAEARRVAEARAGNSLDALLAGAEGAVLSAIERALAQGFAEHLEERGRPALRLLQGGAHPTAAPARRGGLALVR